MMWPDIVILSRILKYNDIAKSMCSQVDTDFQMEHIEDDVWIGIQSLSCLG